MTGKSLAGRSKSEEHKARIAASLRGRPKSAEHRANLAKAMPHPHADFIQKAAQAPHGPDDPCLLWPGVPDDKGYGKHKGRSAHRFVLEARDGPPPPGKTMALHNCRNRLCVVHTRWGTAAENSQDMIKDGTSTRGRKRTP